MFEVTDELCCEHNSLGVIDYPLSEDDMFGMETNMIEVNITEKHDTVMTLSLECMYSISKVYDRRKMSNRI